MIKHFPQDHYIEEIRGLGKPTKTRILRTMAGRVKYCQKQIQDDILSGKMNVVPGGYRNHYRIEELKVIAGLIEIAEKYWKEHPNEEI